MQQETPQEIVVDDQMSSVKKEVTENKYPASSEKEIDVDEFLEEALRLSNKMVVPIPSQNFVTEIDDTGYTGLTYSMSDVHDGANAKASPYTPGAIDLSAEFAGLAASTASCPPVPDEREV